MVKRSRTFDGHGTTERYGAELHAAGFATVRTQTDCGYYGQWANPTTRTIVAFTEGDVTRTECDTDDEFASEMQRIAAWHGQEEWIGIDPCNDDLNDAFTRLGIEELLTTKRPACESRTASTTDEQQLANAR